MKIIISTNNILQFLLCVALGEALRRVAEVCNASYKGEAGTGNVVEAVRHHSRSSRDQAPAKYGQSGIVHLCKNIGALLIWFSKLQRKLPVVSFAAGGVATPADAALMMQLGFGWSVRRQWDFQGGNPAKRARAMVEAVTHFRDAKSS